MQINCCIPVYKSNNVTGNIITGTELLDSSGQLLLLFTPAPGDFFKKHPIEQGQSGCSSNLLIITFVCTVHIYTVPGI